MSATVYTAVWQRRRHLLLLLAALVLTALPAWSQLSSKYVFTSSSTAFTPVSGGTVVIVGSTGAGVGTFNDGATAGPLPIGFNFNFNCTNYTQFTVNPSGLMILGSSTSASYNDDIAAAPAYPAFAPYWQHSHMYDGGGVAAGCTMTPPIGVSYLTTGNAPNRVLTIEWHTQLFDANGSAWWSGCGTPMNNFQMHLYEGTNVIDFAYGQVWANGGQPTSASIGIGAGGSDFMSLTPSGGTSATISSIVSNNNLRMDLTPINIGTVYTFTPCQFILAGLTGPTHGGTANMFSGDTLFATDTVPAAGVITRTPFTYSLNGVGCLNKSYTMTITGLNAADYKFVSTGTQSLSGSLNSGQSLTPQIQFTPGAGGRRTATLNLNDGCNTLLYTLYAFGASPGLAFRTGGRLLDTNSSIFNGMEACVGDGPLSIPIDIVNTGGVTVNVNGISAYQLDTSISQGHPPFPFLRDYNGKILPAKDYIITSQPFVQPVQANAPVTFPIAVTGVGYRLYVTFLAPYPGKRSARLYFNTAAQNLIATDTSGTLIPGGFHIDLFARGVGSILSDYGSSGLPRPVTFPVTRIGDSSNAFMAVFNPGQCTLRVSVKSMQIVSGDVTEFAIIGTPSHSIDAATGDALIAPGTTDTIYFRFKPHQLGSRRASVRLATNDSTVYNAGITERGVFYADLYGNGKADLYASDVDFGTALIGGTGADQIHKSVHLKNTLNGVVIISKILLDGADVGEFTAQTTPAWPKLPVVLNGGDDLGLGVVFAPVAAGVPGGRSANLKMVTSNNDTIVARLTGTAGTRTVSVTPAKVVDFGTISAGKIVRRTITITNNGTMPLTLTQPKLSPGSDYSIASLPRLVLAPNQTEYVEITYAPQSTISANATLTIGGNQTNGAVQVTLQGVAVKTQLGGNGIDPNQSANGGTNGDLSNRTPGDNQSVSGVNGEELVAGMSLWQSVPNPAHDQVEIRYSLAKGMNISLELYDASGRLVKVLDNGLRGIGEQRVVVDVRDLASGSYHYRLSADGHSISKSMTIVR